MRKKFTFIDLFSGCGGLSLGLLQAGWVGILGVEKSHDAFQTFRKNLVSGPTRDGISFGWPREFPVRAMTIEDLITDFSPFLRSLRGRVDLIAGGPPCQGFSLAGQRNPNDERNSMFYKYLEIVKIVDPKIVLLENVTGFNMAYKQLDGGTVYAAAEFLRDGLKKLGYIGFNRIVNAVDCGVPQRRPRFFHIGVKEGATPRSSPFEILDEYVLPDFLARKGIGRKPTCRNAISDLEIRGRKLKDWIGYQKGFKELPYSGPRTQFQKYMHGLDGQKPNSLRLARHGELVRKRFAYILENSPRGKSINDGLREELSRLGMGTRKRTIVPLDPGKPSPTITTLPDDYIHYREPRILTVRECARLQAFPDWFSFHGKYTTGGDRRKEECPRYTQVGNAVPPFVAEALGLALRHYYRDLGT